MPTSKPVNSFDFFNPQQKAGSGITSTASAATGFTSSGGFGLGGYRTDLGVDAAGLSYESYGSAVNPGRISNDYNQQRLFTDIAFEKGREELTRQLDTVGQGFNKAENALTRSGRSQRQTILDRETKLAGDLSAGAGGRSYLKDFYTRSLSSDTTRQLMEVDDQIGQLFAGLYTQRGLTEGSILGTRAATYLQQADTYQSLLAQEGAQRLGYAPGQQAPRDYSGLYNLIGSAAQVGGYLFANSGGSSSSSSGGSSGGSGGGLDI